MGEASKEKLYAYVDESGQDTVGYVFVVSVLVFHGDQHLLCEFLERVEIESGKKNAKWTKSKYPFRQRYIELIAGSDLLTGKLYFDTFSDTKKYIELTSFATAKAILKKARGDYKVTVFVDGFKKTEVAEFTRGLRDLNIRTRKIRGVKKDENNAYIRLVDAICGLIRDANTGDAWSNVILARLVRSGIVTEL